MTRDERLEEIGRFRRACEEAVRWPAIDYAGKHLGYLLAELRSLEAQNGHLERGLANIRTFKLWCRCGGVMVALPDDDPTFGLRRAKAYHKWRELCEERPRCLPRETVREDRWPGG
jgi:hypothetical protein